MKISIENLVLICALTLSEAWFLNSYFEGRFEYEPLIAFLVSLSAIFAKDKIKNIVGLSDKNESHDVNLFKEFQSVFPVEPTIRLLKEQDFGGSFHRQDLQHLYDFVDTWDTVEKEFLSKKIEKDKKKLYKEAKKLSSLFAEKTVPVGQGELVSVYSDNLRAQSTGRPDWVIQDAKILNDEADKFIPKYEAFIRNCRKALKS